MYYVVYKLTSNYRSQKEHLHPRLVEDEHVERQRHLEGPVLQHLKYNGYVLRVVVTILTAYIC